MRLLLFIASLFLACVPEAPAIAASDRVAVVRVIDGDTLVIRNHEEKEERIRLIAIDSPEMNYGKGSPECGAREATAALRALVSTEVRIDRVRKDDYGRTLAWVWNDGAASVNEQLLRDGHAEIFRKERHADRERFRKIENQARAARLGMWGCD
ncbi:MAG TPA: thermonuclease family protein [Thermoanaerobaculia bacterium]|nr:thermonuclease family protein [Thermoanaerobaculia bacterium]